MRGKETLIGWLHQYSMEWFELMGYEYRPVHWSELPNFLKADGKRLEGIVL